MMIQRNATRSILLLAVLFTALPLFTLFFTSDVQADCFEDEEYEEALKATEDEWKATRETMQQASAKFKEFKGKYQEYEDLFFNQGWEKGIKKASEIFGFDPSDEQLAKQYINDIREMFNSIDRAGLKTKLESLANGLETADKVAGEVDNAFQFAKKYDPAHAKDNPTYGLRLIGTTLTESAEKLNEIPLVGQILGKWVAAYGEVAGDFANALDRLSKKIKDFRQGSLCAQFGTNTDARQAFDDAAKTSSAYDGETCLTFFPTGAFRRMRGLAFEGGTTYFLFDPRGCRGYFSPKAATNKVYDWHALLLEPKALDPDWLADRATSLKSDVESRARRYYTMFSGWYSKSDKGWVIIEAIGSPWSGHVDFYGKLDEETFVANYIIATNHHDRIESVVTEYEKYCFASGTVHAETDGGKKPISGATVEMSLSGKTASTTTDANGSYDLLLTGQPGNAVNGKVSAEGFDDYAIDGRFPERVLLDFNFTLGQETATFTITGIVTDVSQDPAVPMAGATVTASGANELQVASATTGADGSYTLSVTSPQGVTISVTATNEEVSGSASVVADGQSHTGVDISLDMSKTDETAPEWTISVDVKDADGKPVEGAAVTGGPTTVATNAAGTAVVGPVAVTKHTEEEPFSITLTATLAVEGGKSEASSPVTVTYAGEPTSAVSLIIQVQRAVDVTIGGAVVDVNGIGVDGATVTTDAGATATTAGGGRFSLGPLQMFPDQAVNISAAMSDGTNQYAAGPVTVTYDGQQTSYSVSLTFNLAQSVGVTITGRVMDTDSKPIAGATITAGGQTTISEASGEFTLPEFPHELGTPVTVSASVTVHGGGTIGGQTTVTPKASIGTYAAITVEVEQVPEVTISGTVSTTDGNAIGGATVTAEGQSTVSDGGGGFTLPPFPLKEGASVTVSASVTRDDGSTASGQASVTPGADGTGNVNITIDLARTSDEDNDEGDDVDELIDELEEDLGNGNYASLLAEFRLLVSQLDGIAIDFNSDIDYFDQRLRELREAACNASDVSASLSSADLQLALYDASLGLVPALYGDIVAASPTEPDADDFFSVEGELARVVTQGDEMQGHYNTSLAAYGMYECDKDDSDVDADQRADQESDPDDVESGAEGGGGVEVCGDQVDNDGDGEIDECDAGCCEKTVQITVSDCGSAADDIFEFRLNGSYIGTTPKGYHNTVDLKLDPGNYTVTIICLDDGSDPPGNDIGTACVEVVVYGEDSPVGGAGSAPEIPYLGSAAVTFNVPSGPGTPTVPPSADGSGHRAKGLR